MTTINHGNLILSCRHQELLKLNGWYAKMWVLQQPTAKNNSKTDKSDDKKIVSKPSEDDRPNYMYSRPKSTRFFSEY